MDNGGMPVDWKPSPPPEKGSWAWKRETAVQWLIEHDEMRSDKLVSRIVRLPTVEGVDLGYMAIRRDTFGVDYIYSEEIETPAAALQDSK